MKNISTDAGYGNKASNLHDDAVMGQLLPPEIRHCNTEGDRVHLIKVGSFANENGLLPDGHRMWRSSDDSQQTTWPNSCPLESDMFCTVCHKNGTDWPRLKLSCVCQQHGVLNGCHPVVKICPPVSCGGGDAGRMVRSASLGFDLHSRTEQRKDFAASGDVAAGCLQRRGSDPNPMEGSDLKCPGASLTAVLENIPLAYDPKTKRLHIIEVKSHDANDAGVANSVVSTTGRLTCGTCHLNGGHVEPINSNNNDLERCLKITDLPEEVLSVAPDLPASIINRVATSTSLPSRTECSSFSSVSSLSTDFSAALEDLTQVDSLFLDPSDVGFIEVNLDQKSICKSAGSGTPSDACSLDECLAGSLGAKPKKRGGFSGFFSRGISLPWKSASSDLLSQTKDNHDVLNWKLFGRNSLSSVPLQCPDEAIEEYHKRQKVLAAEGLSSSACSTPRRRWCNELVASSTTALILENRPLNLPAKAPEEEQKHRLEYEQMVEAAKRRELKEAKLKKKLMQKQLKHEERLSLASKIWNQEILPNWETMRHCRKARELWWQGIPPSVRGKVWKLAIGNDLNITHELYEICVCRAKDRIRMAVESISVSEDDVEAMTDKEGSVELIKLDVSRTFPQLCIFQKGGPYYDMLHSLLGAYVCYRPDVGYVQGMSFLAAVLILNLEVADAFICFANLLNQPCQLAFFRLDESMMRSYFLTYEQFFEENLPGLFQHFSIQNLSPDLYLIDWIYTLYSRSLPLDVASRVWDVYYRDGDEFLFRTALGILHQYKDVLMGMDFIHVAQFLTKLPEDMIAEPLFKSIELIRMVSEKRSFSQVLTSYVEARQT